MDANVSQPLSEAALELYNQKLDDFGANRGWFVKFADLRRLSNKLAGGPGMYPGAAHHCFRQIICNGEDPADVLGEFLPAAEQKVSRQDDLSEMENFAYQILTREENPVDAFAGRGLDKPFVESVFLVKPLSTEELDFVVRPDGEAMDCRRCPKGQGRFQPVVGLSLKKDLSEAGNSLSGDLFEGNEWGLWTVGSFLVVEDPLGHHEIVGLHGSYLNRDLSTEQNHLLHGRDRLGIRLGKKGLAMSFGREQAEQMAAYKNRSASNRRKEDEEMDRIIGASPQSPGRNLMGGLGTGVPDRRSSDRGRRHQKEDRR